MEDAIKERKEKFLKYITENKNLMIYGILAIIIAIGAFIRTRNIRLFQGYKYIPDVDSYLFVRYAEYIVEHGKLMVIDAMRNIPLGINTGYEATILAYIMAYMYKIFSIFNPKITIMHIAAWYPVIFFVLALFVFFLLVRRIFDDKIALFSTAFLAVVPPFLYRTMAGVSDKEPLGIFFMFLSLYFYVVAWQSKDLKKAILFGIFSGISTGLLGLSWGGVGYVLVLISIFTLIEIFFSKFTNKDFYIYISWFVMAFIFLTTFTLKYGGIKGALFSYTLAIPLLVFICAIVNYLLFELDLLKIKYKVKEKIPFGIISFLLSIVIIVIASVIFFGPGFINNQISTIWYDVIQPEGTTRFQLTVAEGQAPYFADWKNNFNFVYVWLFIIGSVLLFYNFIKPITKYKWHLTCIYILFIFAFLFSKYAPNSILNGKSTLSLLLYIGAPLILFGGLLWLYLYGSYKDKIIFNEITNLDKKYIFLLLWFLLVIVSVRGAIRLFFVFAPITAILVAYLTMEIFYFGQRSENNYHKIASWIFIALVMYLTLFTFTKHSYNQARFTGLGFDPQWQQAMDWSRENTKEDAVFSHWWDYGYWIQTMGKRATVLDGGNNIVYWDHLFGRHVLTGNNLTRALEFLKTHKANYLLIDPSDIGKYPAYASIGSNENYDRLSNIPLFILDPKESQETRDGVIFVYKGGFTIDEDLIYKGNVIPRASAVIAGVFLPLKKTENKFGQPQAILFYNNQKHPLTMGCVYYNEEEINFENADLKSCLRIVPTIQDGRISELGQIGAAFYVSEKVRKTFFGQLYLFNKNLDAFKLIYTDEELILPNVPSHLAVFNGRQIGALRIYGINYPDYIKENPEDLKTEFPSSALYRV